MEGELGLDGGGASACKRTFMSFVPIIKQTQSGSHKSASSTLAVSTVSEQAPFWPAFTIRNDPGTSMIVDCTRSTKLGLILP